MTTRSRAANGHRFARLVQWHRQHLGLYARVAAKTAVTPAYVSLVARGFRRNTEIAAVLSEELEQLAQTAPR